jgi:SAM-dependent methyltransferase
MSDVAKSISDPGKAVFHSRAVRSLTRSLEEDPDVMVHQQLARLRFFEEAVGAKNRRVLDFGCGSGFNCHELTEAKEILGFDVSSDAILLASRSFPDCRFVVGDACSPSLSLGSWDRILCCEVLEHVPDMEAFLDNLKRHLAPGGKAFISTPNRDVFSLGYEPSPMNREHIKELNLQELSDLLTARFNNVEILGQSFRDPALLKAWEVDVREKIASLEVGTRWTERPDSKLTTNPLLRAAYKIPLLQRAWKWLRWSLIEGLKAKRAAQTRPYSYTDFEFRKDDLSQAIWFCAIVSS